MKSLKFKLRITPEAVYLGKQKLEEATVANIAYGSKVIQWVPDGLILETSLKMPGAWRLPIEILKRLW